jgi:hypothetical protein
MSYNKHKYFQIFRLWAYQMKVIPEGFERTRWRLFQKALSVPDEGYSRRLWAYQMKVISEGFERTRWMLFQKALSVPDECYSKRLWAYQMNVIPKGFERTRWMLFQNRVVCPQFDIYVLSMNIGVNYHT